MKFRNKQMEKLFQFTLNDFATNISECKKYTPNMVKMLNLENPDPHIQYLINAYALIHTSYKYNEEILANQQLTSVLFNILRLYLYPPMGIIKCNLKSNSNYTIEENTLIKDGKTQLRVVKKTVIQPSFIENCEMVYRNGKPHLQLNFIIHDKVDNIDIFTHPYVIKSLFFNGIKKEIIVQNTKEYSTKAYAMWNPPVDLQSSLCFKEQFCHFTIYDINNTGFKDKMSIYIPIDRGDDILNYEFSTNNLIVSNDFYDVTDNIKFVNDVTEYWLPMSESEIIDIRKVYAVTDQNTIEIVRCTENADGWYTIVNDDRVGIGFGVIKPDWIYFFCDVHCINKNIKYDKPDFEEYTPITLEWKKYLSSVERNIYKNKITNITSLLSVNIENIGDIILNFIRAYDPFQIIELHVDRYEIIGHITRYGNSQFIEKGYKLFLRLETEDIIIIYGLMNEIRKQLKIYCAFQVTTPIGILYYD